MRDCFEHLRPFDGQRRVWTLYLRNPSVYNWRLRSNPEWPVLLEVGGPNRHNAADLVFFNGVKIVQSTQKEQLGDLLDHIDGVGNAAGTGGILVGVDFASQFAGEHVWVLFEC